MLKLPNLPNFSSDLKNYVVKKSDSELVLEKYAPLTNHLVNHLLREESGDSKTTAFAKSVARAITYFLTVVTGSLLYQRPICVASKTLVFAAENTKYAKAALDSLREYNVLRDQITKDGEHEKNYLSPNNLHKALDDVTKGEIHIELTDSEKAKAKANLEKLDRLKVDKYDTTLKAQVESISKYLKTLPADKRFDAHREIISALVSLPTYGDLSEKDRLEMAVEISNMTVEALIKSEVTDMLDDLGRNHNFIKLNQKIGKLSDALAPIFGIDKDMAVTLVSQFLKQAIEARYTSLDSFSAFQLSSLDRVTDDELKATIDGIEKNYLDLMERLVEKRDNICYTAVNEDQKDVAAVAKALKGLKSKEAKLEKEFAVLNEKLALLAKGTKRYMGIIPILQTEAELKAAKKENRKKHAKVIEDMKGKVAELHAINHGKDINFEGKDLQDIRLLVNQALQEEVVAKALEGNLAIKNKYAFRAFVQYLSKVDSKESPTVQVTRVAGLRSALEDESKRIKYWRELPRRFFSAMTRFVDPVDKEKAVSIPSVTEDLHTGRSSIALQYQDLDVDQRAHYRFEVERQIGSKPTYLRP